MKIAVYNIEGKKVGDALLPKDIFDVKMNPDLVHQVVVSQMSNRRQGSAHTKDRSEVRGGGKKPWRQKGTGRARAGSSRSPIWKGGGVTHGPRNEKNYKKDIPAKIRRKAMFMVLSEKAQQNLLVVLDNLSLDKIKTSQMAKILNNLPCKDNCLIATPANDQKVFLSARNIPKINTTEARNLNVLDLMSRKYLLMTKETIDVIKETFARDLKNKDEE